MKPKTVLISGASVAGLTLGLVVGILILLWVQDERSFDSFHRKTAETNRMEL